MENKSFLTYSECIPSKSTHSTLCIKCGTRKGSIFCGLSIEQLRQLEEEKIIFNCQPKQIIFSENNPPFMTYHIFSGQIKITKTGWKGESFLVQLLGKGDIFGYTALLANEPYKETAMAVEPAVICGINKETFLKVLQDSPEFAMRLMAKLSRDIHALEEQTFSLVHETVKQRTARLLLFFFNNREDKQNRNIIKLKYLSHTEMAQMIGTTPESFSRALRFLAEKGCISVNRDAIIIVKPDVLQKAIPEIKCE